MRCRILSRYTVTAHRLPLFVTLAIPFPSWSLDASISLMGDTQQQEQGEHVHSHECKNCSSSTGALPILLSDPAYWAHRDSWYWYLLTLLIPPDFGRLHKTCRKGNKKIMDVCPISETASFHVHSRAKKTLNGGKNTPGLAFLEETGRSFSTLLFYSKLPTAHPSSAPGIGTLSHAIAVPALPSCQRPRPAFTPQQLQC